VERTLIVVRHAKSDWSVPVGDRERPLAPRGRRQAPEAGRWIAAHLQPDLAIVSPAARARQTWELMAAELPAPPPTRVEPAAYAFSGDDLLDLVSRLPDGATTVALVGHNPAVEELIEALTGQWVRMPTAALAVVTMSGWDAGAGLLRGAGRPADGGLGLDLRR
jgi:phosphohistidine phosphatase